MGHVGSEAIRNGLPERRVTPEGEVRVPSKPVPRSSRGARWERGALRPSTGLLGSYRNRSVFSKTLPVF